MFKKSISFNPQVIPASLAIAVLGFLATSAAAGQIGDRSYFDHAPRLVRSAVSTYAAETPSIYQFTVSVPQDAGAALQALKIVQEPNLNRVAFSVSQSSAFLGNSFSGGTPVSIAPVGGEMPQNSNEVTLMFNPPIQPGQTVTVSLDARRNPLDSGVYLFGVTAYPQGETNNGLFLGHGRIHIYDH